MFNYFLFLLTFISLSCSNKNKPVGSKKDNVKKFELILRAEQKNISASLMDSTRQVLLKRLKSAGYENVTISINSDSGRLAILSDSFINIYNQLLKPCRVKIYECYDRDEMNSILNSVNTTSMNSSQIKSLDTLKNIISNEAWRKFAPTLMATIYQTSKQKFDNHYQNVKPFLPVDVKMALREMKDSYLQKSKPMLEVYFLKDNLFAFDTYRYIQHVKSDFDDRGMPIITVELDEKGTELFSDITGKNAGHTLAILIDEEVYTVPLVNEKITGGKFVIIGTKSLEENNKLVKAINAGYLPVNLLVESVDLRYLLENKLEL